MKKLTICLVAFLLTFSALIADEIMQPAGKMAKPYQMETLRDQPIYPYTDDCGYWEIPEWEFVTDPVDIMTSYYDYMPSSYEGYPIQHQTENGDGYYYTWHATPDDQTGTNRRQYWAYINADGTLYGSGTISTDDIWQGYGNFAIHPATGNAIASWHQERGLGYGTTITYDNYTMLNQPGFWADYLFIPPEAPLVNEYIWPFVYVAPSPEGEDYVRIFQLAKNYTNNSFGNPCEDVRVAYCDVPNEDTFTVLDVILELDTWTFSTPMFYWREKDCRPLSQAFAVDWNNPGTVAFFGEAAWLVETWEICRKSRICLDF